MLCIANLCTVLTLGLLPFHSPQNEVYWLEDRAGLRFGRFGSIVSAGSFIARNPQVPEASLELWVETADIWRSGTLVAFYRSGNPYRFSLRQVRKDLVLRVGPSNGDQRDLNFMQLDLPGVFDKRRPVFLTVTSG